MPLIHCRTTTTVSTNIGTIVYDMVKNVNKGELSSVQSTWASVMRIALSSVGGGLLARSLIFGYDKTGGPQGPLKRLLQEVGVKPTVILQLVATVEVPNGKELELLNIVVQEVQSGVLTNLIAANGTSAACSAALYWCTISLGG